MFAGNCTTDMYKEKLAAEAHQKALKELDDMKNIVMHSRFGRGTNSAFIALKQKDESE